MKEEEILEGNILTAEVMGRTFQAYKGSHSYNKKFRSYQKCCDFIRRERLEGFTPQLGWKLGVGKYNSSWDWLMPAAHKGMGETLNRSGELEKINDNLTHALCRISKEEIWLAVVEYGRWYRKISE